MLAKVSLLMMALLVGVLILTKVFIYPNCYSFDSHDDANHAFPGLCVSRAAIRSGELPTINFFNNFGAPLLGDGLTYPFALQTLTYYVLDNPVAMTVNRFLIAIVTIIAAFGFFRIYLGIFASLVCAVLIYFNPVAFWYPVHQYQMATPLFFLSLYLLNKLNRHPSALNFFFLALSSCILVLSVSINLVVFMVPFFLTWSLCRNRFRIDLKSLAPLAILALASLFFYPQTLDFFRNFFASARAGEGVYESILTSPREVFLGLIIPPSEWIAYNYGAQFQVTSYLSMPLMLAILSGVCLRCKKSTWKEKSLYLCGMVPTVLAIVLYVKTGLRFKIPFLKSVDILRVLWFSMPFCYVYVGYFIGYARLRLLPHWLLAGLLGVCVLTLILLRILPEAANASPFHSVILLLVVVGATTLLFSRNRKVLTRMAASLLIGAVILTPVPVIARVLGLNVPTCSGTQYSDALAASRFSPFPLLHLMEKDNRLATEIHTHKGHDLRVAPFGILGSDARAIAVNRKFGKYLEDRRLVTVDQIPYGYYFSRPWQTDELSRLGIRYLLINSPSDLELQHKGWSKLGEEDRLSLYENPMKPSPIYLLNAKTPRFIHNYQFLPNRIQISLPAIRSTSTLVVTILNRYGFEATIDEKQTKIENLENGFISLNLKEGDRIVELRHHPYSWPYVLAGMFVATFGFGLYGRRLSRQGIV